MSHSPSAAFPVYQPSGKLAWHAPLKVVLIGVPGAIFLAWLYALSLHYSPLTIVSLFALAFFSVMLGVLASAVLKGGHSRSRRFNGVAGAVLGFVFLWAQWVLWIRMSFDQGPVMAAHFATSGPLGWVEFLGMLGGRLREIEPQRFMGNWMPLWWGVEAALLIWLPTVLARSESDEPYSEVRKAWAEKDFEGELWWDEGASAELSTKLAEEGVAFLLGLPRAIDMAGSLATQWWTVTVAGKKVSDDPEARWLDVGIAIQKREDNGKVKVERQPVVASWQVSAADFDLLRAHLNQRSDAVIENLKTLVPAEDDEEDGPPPTPAELMPAVDMLDAGDYQGALAVAEAQHHHPDLAVRTDAVRMSALCLSRLERWSAAYDDYLVLFDLEPGVRNALQLATTAVMKGDLAQGQSWIEKAEALNAAEFSMPWPLLKTGYLSALSQKEAYGAGMPQIEWLRDMFMSMRVTDDHFVYSHHMPFLSVFFEKSLPFLRAGLTEPEVRAWYESMRPRLDEGGQTQLDDWLAALQKG